MTYVFGKDHEGRTIYENGGRYYRRKLKPNVIENKASPAVGQRSATMARHRVLAILYTAEPRLGTQGDSVQAKTSDDIGRAFAGLQPANLAKGGPTLADIWVSAERLYEERHFDEAGKHYRVLEAKLQDEGWPKGTRIRKMVGMTVPPFPSGRKHVHVRVPPVTIGAAQPGTGPIIIGASPATTHATPKPTAPVVAPPDMVAAAVSSTPAPAPEPTATTSVMGVVVRDSSEQASAKLVGGPAENDLDIGAVVTVVGKEPKLDVEGAPVMVEAVDNDGNPLRIPAEVYRVIGQSGSVWFIDLDVISIQGGPEPTPLPVEVQEAIAATVVSVSIDEVKDLVMFDQAATRPGVPPPPQDLIKPAEAPPKPEVQKRFPKWRYDFVVEGGKYYDFPTGTTRDVRFLDRVKLTDGKPYHDADGKVVVKVSHPFPVPILATRSGEYESVPIWTRFTPRRRPAKVVRHVYCERVKKAYELLTAAFEFDNIEQAKVFLATWFNRNGSILLVGVPGTGKSTLVESATILMCNDIDMHGTVYRQGVETGTAESPTPLPQPDQDGVLSWNVVDAYLKDQNYGFLGIAKYNPDKMPDEIFYQTAIGLDTTAKTQSGREVQVQGLSETEKRETHYKFEPKMRPIVDLPIKFHNEANRMNDATADALLGLMAEKQIEFLGRTFFSPREGTGSLHFYDMNQHVRRRASGDALDRALLDRIDSSIILSSPGLGARFKILKSMFGSGGSDVRSVLLKRVVEEDFDPFTYNELQDMWDDVKLMTVPEDVIFKAAVISMLFTVSFRQYRNEYGESKRMAGWQMVPLNLASGPRARATAPSGSWMQFVDKSAAIYPDSDRASQPHPSVKEAPSGGGMSVNAWLDGIKLALGNRVAESLVKMARAYAYLESCIGTPRQVVYESDLWAVLPNVVAHRIGLVEGAVEEAFAKEFLNFHDFVQDYLTTPMKGEMTRYDEYFLKWKQVEAEIAATPVAKLNRLGDNAVQHFTDAWDRHIQGDGDPTKAVPRLALEKFLTHPVDASVRMAVIKFISDKVDEVRRGA